MAKIPQNPELVKLRASGFNVTVEPSNLRENCVTLSITHNGVQWQSVDLTRIECLKVIAKLNGAVNSVLLEE